MTITFRQLKTAEPSLRKLLNADLDIQVSLCLRRLVKAVNAEIEHFEAERKKLLDKFGKRDESGKLVTDDGGNVLFDGNRGGLFQEEFGQLLDVEMRMDAPKIDLTKIEGFKFSPVDVDQIDPFLV